MGKRAGAICLCECGVIQWSLNARERIDLAGRGTFCLTVRYLYSLFFCCSHVPGIQCGC